MSKTLSFDIQCGNYFCLDEETGGYCEFCLMNPSDLHCMFFDQELEEEGGRTWGMGCAARALQKLSRQYRR